MINASHFARFFNYFGNVIFLGNDFDIRFFAYTLDRVVPLDFHSLVVGSKAPVVFFLDMRHRSLFAQNLFIVMYLELVLGMR